MALTAAQITNLNNSMSAAQDVALGTLVNNVISGSSTGFKVAYGTLATSASQTDVTTGLTTVAAVVVSLGGSPIATMDKATALVGDQSASPAAGKVRINAWQTVSASASAVTVSPASTTFVPVNWVAFGS